MNLLHEEITHKVFGEGDIVEQDDSFITVDFDTDTKKFVYPDAFGKFITLKDRDTAESLKKLISKRQERRDKIERKAEEEKARQLLEQQRIEKLKNLKIHESSQIVFWLDEEEQQNIFNEWQVSAGEVRSGKNKGQPNKPVRLQPNSAGLLTVRTANQPETERKIIGLYMVDEMFSGDDCEDGMVPAHSEYRMKLTDEEAEKMMFWNYYINTNYPHRTTWNSGKYRYFNNAWTARILKDIIALRTEPEAIKEAEDFLEYFCEMNVLEKDNIPEANGALKQK